MSRLIPRHSSIHGAILSAMLSATVVGAAVLAAPTAAHAADADAVDDTYTVATGAVLGVDAGGGLLANDLGIDVGLGLLISLETPPAHGTLSDIGLDGSFTYTPLDGWAGADTFSYCLKLPVPLALCAGSSATVTITTTPVIERISGVDRYATSASVSAQKFTTGVSTVYVASGEVFPDALSASAAAGAEGAPVLLVQKNAIPLSVDTELRRLEPDHIVLLGGVNTVSAAVETALGAYGALDVERVDGADRFAVSAAVSARVFGPLRPVVYIASGEVFPDALSGSAAAGRLGGPVLLVQKDGVPGAVATELARLKPLALVVLGGTNTISDATRTQLDGIAGLVSTRIAGADRYATSATVSQKTFLPLVDRTVYVASGEVFPDALSGSAAAINAHAPVLLVTRDGIPTATAGELDRLNPTRIVVLGGLNTISATTYDQLATHLG
ncbi:cell wall-binding repeat-containing protein [Herbiconiux moechotypicola]|uniref:Cell wall-binding repeat-containing protein n=1 Tax=Herbiconiux moechotypicola TaxID=637393 RepID=A0ABN3DY59_9MICO|nr:cell wall-binding repeat-containing protein [Herbiconiux moechotypicola]MCS5730878.1 cell wall-binding repeat-containing protein [Herbiconiux moechotypicola]